MNFSGSDNKHITDISNIIGVLSESPQNLSPDDIIMYDTNALQFIWTPQAELYYGEQDDTHNDIHTKFLAKYDKMVSPLWSDINNKYLLGVVGAINGKHAIGFFSTNREVYRSQLNECLVALRQDGFCPNNAILITPISGPLPVSQYQSIFDQQSEAQKIIKAEYHNPDVIYTNGDDVVAFIYAKDDNLFINDLRGATHEDIIIDNEEKIDELYPGLGDINPNEIWGYCDSLMLLGRIGTITMYNGSTQLRQPTHLVAFWSTKQKLYDSLLQSCLNRLIKDNYIGENTYISTPLLGTVPLSDVYKSSSKELSQDELDKIELMKKLHLLKPEAKRAAMQKLGLAATSTKNKWQDESEKANLVQPGQKWWAQTSEDYQDYDNVITEFRVPEPYNNHYIDPDDIYVYDDCAIPFVYCNDGQMFYGESGDTHQDVGCTNYDDIIQIYPMLANHKHKIKRSDLDDISLLGRYGRYPVRIDSEGKEYLYDIISFWSEDKSMYDSYLNDCLEQLRIDGYINDDTMISTPFIGFVRYDDLYGVNSRNQLSDEESEKIRIAKELHLLRPAAKKQAMAKLGLKSGSSKNKWQDESEKANLVQPGQKWWAQTSENLKVDDMPLYD